MAIFYRISWIVCAYLPIYSTNSYLYQIFKQRLSLVHNHQKYRLIYNLGGPLSCHNLEITCKVKSREIFDIALVYLASPFWSVTAIFDLTSQMGDSDDEYDRRRRDKFRRERSDYDRSREREDRRRDEWNERCQSSLLPQHFISQQGLIIAWPHLINAFWIQLLQGVGQRQGAA